MGVEEMIARMRSLAAGLTAPPRPPAGLVGRARHPGHRTSPGTSPLRSFDPVRVGSLEAAVWACYYRRQWIPFLLRSVWLVRTAFRMDWVRTVHGAWLVLRGNQLWAPARNDPAAARRCMTRFYALLRLTHGHPPDPAEAGLLEVGWWAVHRSHRRDAGGGAAPLVASLARLNAYLYGTSEAEMLPAARHRARAMDISDAWVAAGCPDGSPLLAAVRGELIRCYTELRTVVHP